MRKSLATALVAVLGHGGGGVRWRRQERRRHGRHHDGHDEGDGRIHDGGGHHHDRAEGRRRWRSTRCSCRAAGAASARRRCRSPKSDDDTVRLDFSEDEPNGLGDQSRAASWNAVTTAMLLTGAPLSGQYRFEISGPIDGPSAGALKTVAILSLMRGDTLAGRHHDDRAPSTRTAPSARSVASPRRSRARPRRATSASSSRSGSATPLGRHR